MRQAAAWVGTAALVVGVERLLADAPAWARMLGICTSLLAGMNAVVLAEASAAGESVPRGRRLLAFLAWPGMHPPAVARRPRRRPRVDRQAAAVGATCMGVGLGLLWTARTLHAAGAPDLAAAWTTGVGLLLAVHFGLFAVLAQVLRAAGVAVRPVVEAPWRSASLTEFWRRRWNRGFSEMMSWAVQRPLTRAGAGRFADLGVFLASGLLHEVAISLPVRAGWGLPTAYFLLHGAVVRHEERRRAAGRAAPGRLWTAAWVLLPVPVLFHPPFLRECILPLVTWSL